MIEDTATTLGLLTLIYLIGFYISAMLEMDRHKTERR